jgi:16S rRNA (guanine1207-N2)-methyltransferase
MASAVYGVPPPELAEVADDARQVSPLVPGAYPLEDEPDLSLDNLVVYAPPGAVERRYVLAEALRALKAGGSLVALAPNDKGGKRLRKELEAFGCLVSEDARRHHRICASARPATPVGLEAAIAEGALPGPPRLGLWSQPGLFSWDRPDPGSAQLVPYLGDLAGAGADLGCGVGVLALAALASPKVKALTLIDIDRRAIAAARRNVADPRAAFLQADLREGAPLDQPLDFVIMNPPFHDGGAEDRSLGRDFIRRAAGMLRRGGVCRLVANVALPYEAVLKEVFATALMVDQSLGYKIYEARK